MQHGEDEKKQKPCKSILYLASEPIKPGHKLARDQHCPLTGCPEVSFDIELPQYTDFCSIETCCPRRTLKTYSTLCLLKLINHDAYISNAFLTTDHLYEG